MYGEQVEKPTQSVPSGRLEWDEFMEQLMASGDQYSVDQQQDETIGSDQPTTEGPLIEIYEDAVVSEGKVIEFGDPFQQVTVQMFALWALTKNVPKMMNVLKDEIFQDDQLMPFFCQKSHKGRGRRSYFDKIKPLGDTELSLSDTLANASESHLKMNILRRVGIAANKMNHKFSLKGLPGIIVDHYVDDETRSELSINPYYKQVSFKEGFLAPKPEWVPPADQKLARLDGNKLVIEGVEIELENEADRVTVELAVLCSADPHNFREFTSHYRLEGLMSRDPRLKGIYFGDLLEEDAEKGVYADYNKNQMRMHSRLRGSMLRVNDLLKANRKPPLFERMPGVRSRIEGSLSQNQDARVNPVYRVEQVETDSGSQQQTQPT